MTFPGPRCYSPLVRVFAVLAVAFALAVPAASLAQAASPDPTLAPTLIRQTYTDPGYPNNPGYPNDPNYSTVPADPGVTASMDVEVTSSDITDIPLSVQPGQTFTIGIDAAPGAHCAGTITFRGPPPIELPDVVANGEICSWSVTTPTIARQGTAIVDTQVSKNGQSWRVAGVVYVNPPGESR
jgi:hypothetical protein